MALTLSNDLTGLVSRTSSAASTEVGTLGASMVSGDNANIEAVDAFLGGSLHDREFFLGALAQTTSYATNVINITENYLDSIASFLQQGIVTIATVGVLSDNKVAVLQKHIDSIRTQVDIFIASARFDGKALLGGGAQDIQVQIGVDLATSTQKITVRNISGNRLYRTSLAHAVNEWIAQDFTRSAHYVNQAELTKEILDNGNLIADGAANEPGTGSGGIMTTAQIAAALVAVRTLKPALFSDGLSFMIPTFTNLLSLQGGAPTLSTATGPNFQATLDDLITGAVAQLDLFTFFGNAVATSLATSKDRITALDVFQSAMTNIRGEQARLRTQKTSLFEAIDALRATINVTEKAANTYTKTDYVLTAQQYSEFIRQIVASVTSLQAANKIPEAAQRLISALAGDKE